MKHKPSPIHLIYYTLGIVFVVFVSSCSCSKDFYDTTSPYKTINEVKYVDIWYIYKKDSVHAILLLPVEKAIETFVILIPGRGGNASDWQEFGKILSNKGYYIWIPDYPGHGLSQGKPSHKRILKTSNYLVDQILQTDSLNNYNKAIWSFSMGSNLAVQLAINFNDDISALVLDGGCTSFEDLAAGGVKNGNYILRLIVASPYPAKKNIGKIKNMKVAIIHSKDDEVVPIEMARINYENTTCEKQFWEVEGNHCETYKNVPEEYVKLFDTLLSE